MSLLIYPDLNSGALAQFPLRKRRTRRTVVNTMSDGRVVKLADPGAETITWILRYTGLTDVELNLLKQFFAAAEGTLNGFTFLDPAANLLAWSDHLENAVWNFDPLLTKTGSVPDIAGGRNAWSLVNTGAAPQRISQTLPAPGGTPFCLSAYVGSPWGATVTALIGTSRAVRGTVSGWSRIHFTSTGDPAATSTTFALELPPGEAIDVYGLQVEPQVAPSCYKPSTNCGVYPNSHFADDSLTITTDAPDSHSVTVNIIYASHL
jgi:hypothetical protein